MKLLIHQTTIRSIWVDRTIVAKIPDEFATDPARIQAIIEKGEIDAGPFRWSPSEGTEMIEILDTAVCGQTDRDPDLISPGCSRRKPPKPVTN